MDTKPNTGSTRFIQGMLAQRFLGSYLAFAVVTSTTTATELDIQGSRFTLDGKPTFLYGISYYGALGAPEAFILQDLDDIQKFGFNWIRVWATWSAFGNNVSAVDDAGHAREPFMKKLKWLIAECDRRGLIVDVTVTRGEGRLGTVHFTSSEAHAQALETLTTELKPWRNWYLDLANEHNIHGRGQTSKYVPFEEARSLRDRVKRVDPQRLVTISYVHDVPKEEVRRYLFDVEVDFLTPHRPRNRRSPRETAQKTRECLTWMRELGRVIPIHYQEPFRRNFSKNWEPTAEDFAADLRGAIEGGAAGWCFHNGDNLRADDGQPRRSFDMRERRLFDQLDSEEIKALGIR